METPDFDFKALWAAQTATQPDLSEVLARIDQYKRSGRRHILLTSITLGITAAIVLFVVFYFQPEFVTTTLGVVVILVAIALYVVVINRDRVLFQKADESGSNQQYLKNLLAIQEKQHFIGTTVLNVYFALLSLGIALYMYEYAARMTLLWAAVTYGITGSWILLNWLYLRPKYIRKQHSKLNGLIDKLKHLQGQLGEE